MSKPNGYRDVLKSDEDLAIFLRGMAKFDREFTEAMAENKDFTLRIEVHGCRGKLNHCRVYSDSFERPNGVSRSTGRVVS